MPNLKIMITNYRMVYYLQKLLLLGYSIILYEDIFLLDLLFQLLFLITSEGIKDLWTYLEERITNPSSLHVLLTKTELHNC